MRCLEQREQLPLVLPAVSQDEALKLTHCFQDRFKPFLQNVQLPFIETNRLPRLIEALVRQQVIGGDISQGLAKIACERVMLLVFRQIQGAIKQPPRLAFPSGICHKRLPLPFIKL